MRQLLRLDSERHPAVNAALDTTINAMREAAEPHDKLSVVCTGHSHRRVIAFSSRAAMCLRIGLEPTGSASGDAVCPIPVPPKSARLTDLNDLVGLAP
jgi:hypothetical protein